MFLWEDLHLHYQENYDYKFLIKIVSAPNKVVWYYRYLEQSFETNRVMKGSRLFYAIDYLHSVPAEHCIVIKKIEIQRYYTKYALNKPVYKPKNK